MKKIVFSLIFLAIACSPATKTEQKSYFDLAKFTNQQILQLTDNQQLTQKKIAVDAKTETIETRKIDWKKELELFVQADLNKQAYQASYDKKATPNEQIYTLKKEEDLPVKFLKITFDSLTQMPKFIEAKLRTKNYLYESEKHLQMIIENGKLKNYRIEGSQELFLGKKRTFSVAGNLL